MPPAIFLCGRRGRGGRGARPCEPVAPCVAGHSKGEAEKRAPPRGSGRAPLPRLELRALVARVEELRVDAAHPHVNLVALVLPELLPHHGGGDEHEVAGAAPEADERPHGGLEALGEGAEVGGGKGCERLQDKGRREHRGERVV